MNLTHLKYHSPIPRNGIYDNSVKLLFALSIFINGVLNVELEKDFFVYA